MGMELVLETSQNLHILTQLSARENFFDISLLLNISYFYQNVRVAHSYYITHFDAYTDIITSVNFANVGLKNNFGVFKKLLDL